MDASWFQVAGEAEIPSPALVVHLDRVEANLREMLRIAGGAARLRPHVKTHKLPQIVRRQAELGITKAKCATIAEAEMAATNGAEDVLLAYQPVGPGARRIVDLAARYPGCRFSCLADDAGAVRALSAAHAASAMSGPLDVLIDLDVGQRRSGIAPGPAAVELAKLITASAGLRFGGLHAYDGHLGITDLAERTQACEAAFGPVWTLERTLVAAGIAVPRIVAGGTPTFPVLAGRAGLELSPGTCVFWDAGYGKKFPDMAFLPAVMLLARVVSKPTADRLCLDLGHKAVASEMPAPRVVFLDLPDAVAVAHNEEHLVVETPHAVERSVGDIVHAIPRHVCPTVALHQEVWVADGGKITGRWQVTARARRLEF